MAGMGGGWAGKGKGAAETESRPFSAHLPPRGSPSQEARIFAHGDLRASRSPSPLRLLYPAPKPPRLAVSRAGGDPGGFSRGVRGQGAVLWGPRTWMSKFAPASISIWTIASSPAAQAYISGVIPCTDQRQMLNAADTEHDGTHSAGLGPAQHRSQRPACPAAQPEQSRASGWVSLPPPGLLAMGHLQGGKGTFP